MRDETLTFERIESGLNKTAYLVRRGGREIGYVFSRVGFSYRGTQGWNRGIRLRDYHPIEWGASSKADTFGVSFLYTSRASAVRGVLLS